MAQRVFWEVEKVRRFLVYSGLGALLAGTSYVYTSISTHANIPRVATPYSGYPAGTELLYDVGKLYKKALGKVFKEEEWGPLEWTIMAKHYQRQGQASYAHHAAYLAHLSSSGEVNPSGLIGEEAEG